MHRDSLKLAILSAACCGIFLGAADAQLNPYSAKELPPAAKNVHVRITQGPELEMANNNLAIIRWTSNNPGGSDEHFGVVHYGTTPTQLSDTAKSPIRLNRNHADTVFRVRLSGLTPRTTYFYTVDSMEGAGASDGVKCAVRHFTTP